MANTPTLPNTDDYVAACPPVTVTLGDVTLDVDATGVTSEQFCTPDCQTVTVIYCKEDGAIAVLAHIPPGATEPVAGPYAGELGDCGDCVEAKAPQWLPGCRGGCEAVAYCLDPDGVVLQWRDADGLVVAGDPGDISPGECPTAVRECVRVWSLDAEGEPFFEAEADCYISTAGEFYTLTDGSKGSKTDLLAQYGLTATTGFCAPCDSDPCDEECEPVKEPQWLTGCRNGCEPVAYCLGGAGEVLTWRDADGVVTEGDPGDISPGECPTAIPECIRVWSAAEGTATFEAETMRFVSIAGEFYTLPDGSKGDKTAFLEGYGLTPLTGFCTPCDVSQSDETVQLVPCPVDAPADGVWASCSVHELKLTACIPDCGPGEEPVPVTVTWKGVTRTVPPGGTWCSPPASCDPIEGDIVVTGEVTYDQAWTLGESTGECE